MRPTLPSLSLLAMFVSVAPVLGACGDKVLADDTAAGDGGGAEDTAAELDACELYAASAACPECADGVVTCSYGEHSETEMSCGGCQAQASLYHSLCEAGVTDSTAEIEAGTECGPAETE